MDFTIDVSLFSAYEKATTKSGLLIRKFACMA